MAGPRSNYSEMRRRRAVSVVPRLVFGLLGLIGGACAAVAQAPPGSPAPPSRESRPADAGPAIDPSGQTATKPGQEMVVEVFVVGVKAIPVSKIYPYIKTRPGRPFDNEMVEEDVRRLDASHMFVYVKTLYQKVAGGRNVIFEVIERPVLTEILFVGNQEKHKTTLAKEAGLKVGESVDPFVIEEARRKLEDFYHKKGYNQARVVLFEGDKPEDRRVVFLIDEGTKKRIWEINFIGNTIDTADRLKTKIHSKPAFLKLFGGEFDPKQIIEDRDDLFDYYRGLGFFNARIGIAPPEYNEKGNWATLTFVIDEGPRYKIRDIAVIGNAKFTTEELLEKAKLKKGDYYDRAKQQSDRLAMTDQYGSIGHAFAEIKPDVRMLEEPGQVDLVYSVKEDKQYSVGAINIDIKGEYPHTQMTTVLNRLSFIPGEIIDTRELRESEVRLKRSQLFEANPATGNPPKIAVNPPKQSDEDKTEVADRPDRPSGRSGFRGQSPDPQPAGSRPAPPTNQPPSWNRNGANSTDESLTKTLNELTSVLPRKNEEIIAGGRRLPAGSILTQYTPNAGQSTPSIQRPQLQWASAQPTAAGTTNTNSATAGGTNATTGSWSANNNSTPSTTPYTAGSQQATAAGQTAAQPTATQTSPINAQGGTTTQPAPVEPSPSYGQDASGFLFNPQSPFNGGPPDGDLIAPPLDIDAVLTETMTGRVQLGVGVNSDSGLVGTVQMDEQNFNLFRFPTSWEDFRNGTAFRGKGQRLNIMAAPGTSTQRYTISFTDPYVFDSRYSLGLSGFYYTRIYNEYTDQRLGGRASLGYQLTHDLYFTTAYRGAKINITNPIDPALPALAEVTGRDLALHGFSGVLTLNKRDNDFLATRGYYAEASLEQVLGSFQYPRAEVDLRKYFRLHERPDGSGCHVLTLATHAGWTGDNTPIYDRFYDGGFTTIRGFSFRSVSPREIGPTIGQPIIVGGNFEFRASAEYMFPITADDMLRTVLFCDTGTVEPSINHWTDRYRVAPGIGLRIAVPAMGAAPIALDFAFPVSWQPGDQQEVFSFFMGFTR